MSCARAIRNAYDHALAELGLTLPEASLLAYIAESEPQTQTQLAEQLGSGKAALGARIDRLGLMGAIQRLPRSGDRRVWLVHLTDKGSAYVDSVIEVDRRLRDLLRRGIPREDRQKLAQTLTRLQANLSTMLDT